MPKHKGGKAKEPTTKHNIPWSKLTPLQKAQEFDLSHANPAKYAEENFQQDKTEGETRGFGGKAKHKKSK